MRALFVAIIMIAFGQPVLAATVYFCQMDVFVGISEHGLKHYTPKRFTMSVDENEVRFAGDNWFSAEKVEVTFLSPRLDYWEAKAPYTTITFSRGRLNYSHSVTITQAFNAKCEKV